jgi:hypothetical protein
MKMQRLKDLAAAWHREAAEAHKESELADSITSLRLYAKGSYIEMCAQELELVLQRIEVESMEAVA